MDARDDAEAKLIERLHYAISDLDHAAHAARYLHDRHWRTVGLEKQLDPLTAAVLEDGMIISYSRAFVKGGPGFPIAPTKLLTEDYRLVHRWVLMRRHQVAAHVDLRNEGRGMYEGSVVVQSEDGENQEMEGPFDRRTPLRPEQLHAIETVAKRLAEEYRGIVNASRSATKS